MAAATPNGSEVGKIILSGSENVPYFPHLSLDLRISCTVRAGEDKHHIIVMKALEIAVAMQ
jgi:hypothetical protein